TIEGDVVVTPTPGGHATPGVVVTPGQEEDATGNTSHYFRPHPRRAASDPEAPEPIGGQPPPVKPRLRGVSHRWAFFASLFASVALVLVPSSKRAVAAAMVYALS